MLTSLLYFLLSLVILLYFIRNTKFWSPAHISLDALLEMVVRASSCISPFLVKYLILTLSCLWWLWLPWTTRWWGGRGRDHKQPVHSCQQLWIVRHYDIGGRKNLLHYETMQQQPKALGWSTIMSWEQWDRLKKRNWLMISSKQQPQRSAAAIASLRAVLTRPGFNGAITWTHFLLSSLISWFYLTAFFSVLTLYLPGEFTKEEDEKDVAGGDGDAGDQRHPGQAQAVSLVFHSFVQDSGQVGVGSDKSTVGWMVTSSPQTLTANLVFSTKVKPLLKNQA